MDKFPQQFTGLKEITLWWDGDGGRDRYIVTEEHSQRFLQALLCLHFEPGVNPHTKTRAKRLKMVTYRDLKPRGPFWWTTPDLQNDDDPNGALIWDWEVESHILFDADLSLAEALP